MFCSNCGKEIDVDSVFCSNCGSQISIKEEDDSNLLKQVTPSSSIAWSLNSLILISLILGSIFFIYKFTSNNINDDFKSTSAGKALYSCVSGDGQLKVNPINLENGAKGVDVELIKSKTIRMQFLTDKKLNQAKLIGASIPGEDDLSQMILMLSLELICGGESAHQILPDAYNALDNANRMMNMFR